MHSTGPWRGPVGRTCVNSVLLALTWLQIAHNIAPKRLVVRGLSPLACCGLLRAMRTNTSVRTLDLASNKLTDAIATSLEKMLVRNKTLQSLDLGLNELTHASLGAIGRALRGNTVLTTLSLESNPVLLSSTDASVAGTVSSHFEAFTTAVATTTSLTSLNLFRTQMSVDVGHVLTQAVAKNTSIVALEVGGDALLVPSDVALLANHVSRNQQHAEKAQSRTAAVRCELADRAEAVYVEQATLAQQQADLAWHDANAKQRADRREQEEWERARVSAEADVRRLVEIAAMDKQYFERLEAEKKPTKGGAKGRK